MPSPTTARCAQVGVSATVYRRRTLNAAPPASKTNYDEPEQLVGFYTMIEDNLAVPFETTVLGMPVTVKRVDMDEADQIVAIGIRGHERQAIPILYLVLPSPAPPGAEWIDAYRHWAGGG